VRKFPTESERFWSKVEKTEGCWIWIAARDSKGYGGFHVGGSRKGRRWVRAHRWAYAAAKGEPPAGLDLDHLCRNRACVNPEHLEPVTRSVNLQRGASGSKTQCNYGHVFTPENTYRQASTGRRSCLACKRAANARWNRERQKNRAKRAGDAS